MEEVLFLAAYALASYGAGSLLLGRAGLKWRSYGEEAVFAQALGLVVFSMLTFAAGYLGLLYGKLFAIAVAAILIISAKRIKGLIVNLWRSIKARHRLNLDSLILIAILAFAALNIYAAHAPVHSSDAIAYHVAVPKIFAEEHRITNIPDNIPSNYPISADMLFLDGYLLKSGELAELIASYIALIFALAVYQFSARYFGRRTGLIGAMLLYTMPLMSVFNIRAFVDIATGLYAFLAVYAFFLWREDGRKWLIMLGGIFAGFAASTKTSALLTPAIIGILFAYEYMQKRKPIDAVKGLGLYGIFAALTMAPSILRAYINTGNPLYPLYYNVLGGAHLNPVLSQYWVDILSKVGFGTDLGALLMLPWNATMHSPAFGEVVALGPAFLAFVPVLLVMRKVDRKVKALLAIALMFIVPWFFTAQILRYIFVVYALLAIASSYAAARMLSETSLKAVAAISLAAILAVNSVVWIGANMDEAKVVSGITAKEDFLKQKITNYELLQYANSNLDNARLCLYGEIRGYYSEHDYVWCHPAYQGYVDFSTINNGEMLLKRLKEIGVTHILVEDSLQGWRKLYEERNITTGLLLLNNGDKAVKELIGSSAKLVYENEHGRIYEIE